MEYNDTLDQDMCDPAGPDASSRAAGDPKEYGGAAARKAVLAGIGAIATACDTAETTLDRLAHRGEQVRQEWQTRTTEVRQRNLGVRGRMRDSLRTVLDSVFDTLNVPSKTDIDAVNVKLNILNRKMDDLHMDPTPSEPSGTAPPIGADDLPT